MKIILYTNIESGYNIPDSNKIAERIFIQRAQILGYGVSKFAGWTDCGLGASGNHGLAWDNSVLNRKYINEVLRSLNDVDPFLSVDTSEVK